jgi:hypothetical protein
MMPGSGITLWLAGKRRSRPAAAGYQQKGQTMGKLLLMGGLAGAGFLIASQRQDIGRYLKIRQMSAGDGHPENVPATGSRQYPAPGLGARDGTGDFDSARRGGPDTTR